MKRPVDAAGLGFATLALIAVPWVGAIGGVSVAAAAVPPGGNAPARGSAPLLRPSDVEIHHGCGCDSVVIDATNVVRDAKIRSGDARSENVAVVYLSSAYMAMVDGQIELEVQQRAQAESGAAVAGQHIGALDGGGSHCKNILIRAFNDVEDTKVRSGDARAINRHLVLLDPGIDPGRVSVDADQQADAKVGEATSGQVIGALQAGTGGCGGVAVEATNIQKDVDIESGEARARNYNEVRTCAAPGCADELRRVAWRADSIRMCLADGCSFVSRDALLAQLLAAATPTPTPSPAVDPTPSSEPTPTLDGEATPATTPAADPVDVPGPPTADPSPSPQESPTPSPTPDVRWAIPVDPEAPGGA